MTASRDLHVPDDVRRPPDRSNARLLAVAGALVVAGSLAPWPRIDLARVFTGDSSSGFLFEHGLVTLPAGIGLIAIGSRIAVEAGRRRRLWASYGLTLIMLVMGLIVAWVCFDLFGESTAQLSAWPLIVLSGLGLIGSLLPISATATRPRTVALVLAVVALVDYLVLFVIFAVADMEYGPNSSCLQLGWLVATLGALGAIVCALKLLSRANAALRQSGPPTP